MAPSIFSEFCPELFSPASQPLAILNLSVLNPDNYNVSISTCFLSSLISPWQGYRSFSYPTNGGIASLHINKASALPIVGGICSTTLSKPKPDFTQGHLFPLHAQLPPLYHPNIPAKESHFIKEYPVLHPGSFWAFVCLFVFVFSIKNVIPCHQLISQCPDHSQLSSWKLACSFPLKLTVSSMSYPALQFLLHCTPTALTFLWNYICIYSIELPTL